MVTTTTTEDNDNDAYDAVVVGAGMMGLCIARDLADSGGHKVLVVEREANLGGIWFQFNYPALGLQGLGSAWRCFSLPPKYHTSGEHDRKSLYRPTAGEILEYAESLARHPNITVSLSTSYEGVDETHISMNMHIVQLRSSSGTEHTVAAKAVILAVGYDTHRTGKPWFPVDPKAVKNGAKLLHSAEIGGQPLGTCKGRTYVVGAHKAAMEVLRGIDNPDGVVWANRGHYTFVRGDFIDEAALAGAPPPKISPTTFVSTSPCHVGTGREGCGSIMDFQCMSRLIGSLRMDVRSRTLLADEVGS
jgi:lysine/ornithine N-monooxygenase